jgi:benzoate membrane transport protein
MGVGHLDRRRRCRHRPELALRAPVITAWSAPGTALLITLFPALSLAEAVGAYLTAAVILLAIGLSGPRPHHGPRAARVASGMMAGILLPFGLNAFRSAGTLPLLAFGMIAAYLVFRRAVPRYGVVLLLVAGTGIAWRSGATHFSDVALRTGHAHGDRARLVWTSTFSLALPLVLVTLTGQYLPGMAVLKTSGYATPARPVIVTSTASSSLAVAFTGGITIAIAAITAAMCTGPRRARGSAPALRGRHRQRRVLPAGGPVRRLDRHAVRGAAEGAGRHAWPAWRCSGPIAANLGGVMAAGDHREAAVITFLATASGMTFLGLGAAFWGIVDRHGDFAHRILHHPDDSQYNTSIRRHVSCGTSTSTPWPTGPRSTASTPACSRGAPSSSSATATTWPWPASRCRRS